MNPVDNPYRPGAGRRPPLLAGRASLLDNFEVVQTRAEVRGEGDRSWVLNGLRGVGKTVLLGELFARATARQWIAAKIEVGGSGPLPAALSRSLKKGLVYAPERGLLAFTVPGMHEFDRVPSSSWLARISRFQPHHALGAEARNLRR